VPQPRLRCAQEAAPSVSELAMSEAGASEAGEGDLPAEMEVRWAG
jgi:hypothetical protein